MLNLSLLDLKLGDCVSHLSSIPDDSVDLIITSPPYADRRKDHYQSVKSSDYIKWFSPIALELKRVLKPSGSFFLNLKAHCSGGERNLYVYELIIHLRNITGFKFVDEYVWYKSAAPRKKSYRLKDAWEPIFHFSLGKNFINHEAMSVFSKSTFINKRGYRSYNDLTGNIGGYHDIAGQGDGFTDHDNILYFPTSLMVKDKYEHPAKFPLELVDFLIRGFCPDPGAVLDPFMGSGTTALSALRLERKCIGIEIMKEYFDMTLKRVRSKDRIILSPSLSLVMPDIF